jgi:hypothetical protein
MVRPRIIKQIHANGHVTTTPTAACRVHRRPTSGSGRDLGFTHREIATARHGSTPSNTVSRTPKSLERLGITKSARMIQ